MMKYRNPWLANLFVMCSWIIISLLLDPQLKDLFLIALIPWLISLGFVINKIVQDNKHNNARKFFHLSMLPWYIIGSNFIVLMSGHTYNDEGGWWILYALLFTGSIVSGILVSIGLIEKAHSRWGKQQSTK